MNGITTIAALPNGAGQAAHLPAEVGETKQKFQGYGIDDLTDLDLAAGEYDMAAYATYTRKHLDPKTGAVLREEPRPAKFQGAPWNVTIIPKRAITKEEIAAFYEMEPRIRVEDGK
ncbi:hypothetical protein [Variovorax ginsengisoli]|uniref:Uncharacterized protein n=1 Tax=Variovorax ginsengisoli TaxID=363844 RepID=A0ABT8RZ40_9BURK|nr:hypothetical protein [Variovorax ginsengisoli]MDN8612774.1 hypothetical protein [Variovorax ginsengisoli]MDO1531944.1 hypothetical protein [Variovorax ginsengisoli]